MVSRKFRKSTITDVANAAGVSKGAVSAYVSGRTSVCSSETAERIDKAIIDLHYSRGPVMRGARDRSTNTIGVALPEFRAYRDVIDDLYNFRLRCGVQTVMNDNDLALLTYPTSVLDNVNDYLPFVHGRVDGLMIGATNTDCRPAKIASAGLPTVVFGRYKAIPEGCGASFASEKDIVDLALTHLFSLGHRRIAHVAGGIPDVSGPVEEVEASDECSLWRFRHYVEWMSEHGNYDPCLVNTANGWKLPDQRATEIMQKWLSLPDRPTAIFCANDQLAHSIMKASRTLGVDVPEKLSVVGIDDDLRTQSDELTTVNVPLEEVGRVGARALIDCMNGRSYLDCRIMTPVKDLIVRNSTSLRFTERK